MDVKWTVPYPHQLAVLFNRVSDKIELICKNLRAKTPQFLILLSTCRRNYNFIIDHCTNQE